VGPVRGDERFAVPQILAKEATEFQIRWSSTVADVHPQDRVLYPPGSGAAVAVYDIAAVHEIGRREGLRLIAERNPDAGLETPAVTLAALSLSATVIVSGAAENTLVGTLSGVVLGSVLSLVNDAGGQFKLSGASIVAGAVPASSLDPISITVRETHASGTNSPRDTSFNITVVPFQESLWTEAGGTFNGQSYGSVSAYLAAASGTFARASIGTYFDIGGLVQTALAGALRLDHDPITHTARGYRCEGERTNRIPNSVLAGAVSGSPGTSPTSWTGGGSDADVTKTVVPATSFGVAGLNISCVADRANISINTLNSGAHINCVSVYAEDFTGSDGALIDGRSNSIAFGIAISRNASAFGAGKRAFSVSPRVSADITTANNRGISIGPGVNNITTQAATMFMPQQEFDVWFPSTWAPTTTAPVTRVADALAYAASGASAGTVVVEGRTALGIGDEHQVLWQWDDGTDNNRLRIVREGRTSLIDAQPNIIANGDFATNDLTGWTAVTTGTGSISAATGAAVISRVDASNTAELRQSITTTAGARYSLRFSISGTDGQTLTCLVGTTAGAGQVMDSGTLDPRCETAEVVFTATGTTTHLTFKAVSNPSALTIDNITCRRWPDSPLHAIVTVGGVDEVDLELAALAHETDFAVAFSWEQGSFAASLNGAAAVTDTTYAGALPTVSTLREGRSATAGEEWYGTIAEMTRYRTAHTAAQVEELAS
jgi:hypothetical protein